MAEFEEATRPRKGAPRVGALRRGAGLCLITVGVELVAAGVYVRHGAAAVERMRAFFAPMAVERERRAAGVRAAALRPRMWRALGGEGK